MPGLCFVLPKFSDQGGEPEANSSLLSCLLRSQETHRPVMVVVLTFLPAPMLLVVAYGFWKKRHMGSEYSQPWPPRAKSKDCTTESLPMARHEWPSMFLKGMKEHAESREGQSHPGELGH